MNEVTSKLEINMFDNLVDPNHLAKIASQNKIPVIIVKNPQLIPHLHFLRSSTSGSYFKVVLAVDFDSKGSNYVISKFSNFDPSWIQADGFEIVLTPKENPVEVRNEVQALSSHLKKMSPSAEVRYCINMFSFNTKIVENMISSINGQNDPRPAFIRIDQSLENPKRDIMEYAPKCLQIIRKISSFPVKASTNVTLDSVRALKDQIARFDVSLKTAELIINQLKAERIAPTIPAADA